VPLLIDTDIGTDPDDLQVLMMAGRLGLDVVGITTVYGDTDRRARMAAAVAPLVGVDCPIVAGCRETLSRREVKWAGYEGDGVPGIDTVSYRSDVSAPRFLGETAATHAGELDVLAIGPLTNLAVAMLADPSLADRIRHLHVMGGDYSGDPERIEHNASADPLATWVVLRSGIPTTVVGLEMTSRVVFSDDDHARVADAGEAGRVLADNTRRFLELITPFTSAGSPRGHVPHDPIALLTRQRPDLFETETCRVEIVGIGPAAGRVRAVPDAAGSVQVVRSFDAEVVRALVVDLLAADGTMA
jgi:purine nucleosidase